MNEWTEEMKDALETLAGEGLTYSDIAVKLSEKFGVHLTKNACVGMGRRLKVAPRKPLRTVTRINGEVTIDQLRHSDCRWPSGSMMARPPFTYCGKKTVNSSSWCREHWIKAHTHRQG